MGSHLPLSVSPGLPSYYFWGSGSGGSPEIILPKPFSSRNFSKSQVLVLKLLEGVSTRLLRLIGNCHLPASRVHSLLREKEGGGTGQPLMDFSLLSA